MSCFALTSCDSDDDDESFGNYSIVGTWKCDSHYYGGADYYTFKSNGTYSWRSVNSSWFNPDGGRYSYSGGILSIVNNRGTSWIYGIQFIDKHTFILVDEDGNSYVYEKE